jgi:hypothetical protein
MRGETTKIRNVKIQDFTPRLMFSRTIVNTVTKGDGAPGLTYLKCVGQFQRPIDYVRLTKYLADVNYLGP